MWRLPPFRGLVTLVAGEGASRLLSFAAIALLTRRLGVSTWAPVAVALTVVQFAALFVEAGMRLFGAREVARSTSAASTLARPIVSTQLLMAAAAVALTTLAAWFAFLEPSLGALLPGYIASLLALPFYFPWIFQGRGEMGWVAGPQVVRFAVFLALSALVVGSPSDVGRLPWVECASMVAGAAVATIAVRSRIDRGAGDVRRFDGRVVREALPIAGSQMIWVVRMYLPILVLWYLAARESVAHFDVSHRLLMVLQAFLTVYLANLYTPLSRAAPGPRRPFLGLLLASTAFAGLGAAAAAVMLAVRPAALLGMIYGAAYANQEAAACLTTLALVVPVLAVRGHAHYALVSLGRQRRELACAVAGGLVLVLLLLWWVPGGGAAAGARAMLASELAGLVLTWIALWHALRQPRGEPLAQPVVPAG